MRHWKLWIWDLEHPELQDLVQLLMEKCVRNLFCLIFSIVYLLCWTLEKEAKCIRYPTEDTMTLTVCAGYFLLAERQLLLFFSQDHTSVSSGTLFLSVFNK